jgi:hypothetical protein
VAQNYRGFVNQLRSSVLLGLMGCRITGGVIMKRTLFLTFILGLVLCHVIFAEEAFKNGVKKEFYPDGKLME